MLGKLIGWSIGGIFTIIGSIWNVICTLFGYAFLALIVGLCVSAAGMIFMGDPVIRWAVMLGVLVGGIKFLVNEVAVPQVHAHERRERERQRAEFEAEWARSASRRDGKWN
jgi:NADH:ubiquinone oxidoreductase subunit 6 (subunit J)